MLYEVKTNTLIRCAVTAQLVCVCVYVFAYAKGRVSHDPNQYHQTVFLHNSKGRRYLNMFTMILSVVKPNYLQVFASKLK